jgi:predicted nucleic acid binding AN1-type Zn finger protein
MADTMRITSTQTTLPNIKKSTFSVCGYSNCGKKLGLMSFECRCKHSFCAKHRLPEQHECKFDHKSFGKSIIEKNNEKIVADKIENRI